MNIVPYVLLYFVAMMVASIASVSFTRYLYRAAGVTPAQVRRAHFPGARRELYDWLAERAGYSRQFRTMLWLSQGMVIPLLVFPLGAILLRMLHLETYIWIVAVAAGVLTLVLGVAAWRYGRRIEAETEEYFYGIGPHPYIEQAKQEGAKPRKSRSSTHSPRLGGNETSLSHSLAPLFPILIIVLFTLAIMFIQVNGS